MQLSCPRPSTKCLRACELCTMLLHYSVCMSDTPGPFPAGIASVVVPLRGRLGDGKSGDESGLAKVGLGRVARFEPLEMVVSPAMLPAFSPEEVSMGEAWLAARAARCGPAARQTRSYRPRLSALRTSARSFSARMDSISLLKLCSLAALLLCLLLSGSLTSFTGASFVGC